MSNYKPGFPGTNQSHDKNSVYIHSPNFSLLSLQIAYRDISRPALLLFISYIISEQ